MLAGLLATASAGAQIEIPEQASVQQVAPGLHVIRGVGGNIALSTGPDGVLIVDDDMPPLSGKIAAAIATVTPDPVSLVFNTHWHFDHAGGNRYFGERGALIVAQDNVHKRLSEKQFSKLTGTTTPPAPAAALPVITFDRQLTFHLNGLTIRAEHVPQPAHTDGDAIIFFEEINVVHMGDTFFNGLYPVIDISSGGTADGILAAIDAVMPRLNATTVVIPGHGPVSDRDGLRGFREMLSSVNERVKELVAAGKSADEVVALRPTRRYDEQWAWNFMPPERWTRLMYDSAVASAATRR
ncbi:MAG: MBL fold metallo-hydrolase [Gammaproteobacteria bacterium]|nr:MBL fold metallo-hydrolase [Gammaproteobacteria bacterium]